MKGSVTGGAGASRDVESAILEAVAKRGADKTICPSEVARSLSADWRPLMPEVRRVAQDLADAGRLRITQKGRRVDAMTARGPIRLGLPEQQEPG